MNTDLIKGNWQQLKGKVKQTWGKISDNELEKMQGNYDELAGFLHEKYGYNKEKIKDEINSFLEDNNIQDIIQKTQSTLETATQYIYDIKDKAREKLQHSATEIKEKACEAQVYMTNQVKSNPFVTLGIAFIFGMCINKILRR